jgi:hypothetical protein
MAQPHFADWREESKSDAYAHHDRKRACFRLRRSALPFA